MALAPTGIGFTAGERLQWDIRGGGIFSNSSAAVSGECRGSAGVAAPSATVVGGTAFTCSRVDISKTVTDVPQLPPAAYVNLLPVAPACDGTATEHGGIWMPEPGAHGGKVAIDGNMNLAAGLYCITNSPGALEGHITGRGVTFFIVPTDFDLQFAGEGDLEMTAPAQPDDYVGADDYLGLLLFRTHVF